MKTKRMAITREQAHLIYWLMDKLTEWTGYDDRPDHGKARIEEFIERARTEKREGLELSESKMLMYDLYRRARRRCESWGD